jgi:predicted RNA binding protein YcfA (HicA-like mRNA interferase family)
MTFWERVALHESRGCSRPVALRAARIMEARGARWNELLHPRNRQGEFTAAGAVELPPEFVGSRFPAMSPKQVTRLLRKAGFQRTGQKGSHAMWEPPGGGRKVVVPMHGAKSIPRGTLMSILNVASAGVAVA